jgi:hypothetical protein
VPDNLKSAVSKSSYYEPEINPTYADMAEHYGCVVIPARPAQIVKEAEGLIPLLLISCIFLEHLFKLCNP